MEVVAAGIVHSAAWGGSSVDKSSELTFTGRGFEPARPTPDRSLPAEKTESCKCGAEL